MRYRNDHHTSSLRKVGVAKRIVERLVALKDVRSSSDIAELRLFVHRSEAGPSFGEITAFWTSKEKGTPSGSRNFGWSSTMAFGYSEPPLTERQLAVINELAGLS